MEQGRWIAPRHADTYHGRADGAGGPAWVYPRVHTTAGIFVEVHVGAPDGALVRRTAVSHRYEAVAVVQDLRDLMRRGGVEAVTGDIDPVAPRGSVIVHAGIRPNGRLVPIAALDGEMPTLTCARLWSLPGPRRVTAGFVVDTPDDPHTLSIADARHRVGADVEIRAGITIDLRHSFLASSKLRPPSPRRGAALHRLLHADRWMS